MRIGIDASRANHEQKTGVEWYCFHLIEEMKKFSIFNFQFSITFVLYSDIPLQGELAKLPPNWESKVLRWPPKRLWTQVRLSWEMLVNPPDVLFIPAHVFPIIHPKKTVMTVHDVAAARFPEGYSWFERWYSLWSARFAVKHLWKVIVPSEFTKSELTLAPQHLSTSAREKIIVVPHGYDERYKIIEDKNEIENVLKKYGIRRPFIMSVGRLEEKKNTARLVKSFNVFRSRSPKSEVRLLLVGSPGFGYAKVNEAIKASAYKDDIITPGWVHPDGVVSLMNAASAFVFPSLYEGFGLPVLEAFACGTPVVAARGSSLEEVGGPPRLARSSGEAGDAAVYVDPMDSKDIAEGIVKVLSDGELRERNIRRGLERVKGFSWQTCTEETLKTLLF